MEPIAHNSPWPIYFFDLVDSPRVRKMDETQSWWYFRLLGHAHYSQNPGFLPNDPEVLWQLAGATTRRFFEKCCGPVLACFVRTDDGLWLYHPRSIVVLQDSAQTIEHKRVRHISQPSIYIGLTDANALDLKFQIAYKNYPRHVGKRAAHKAFYSACSRHAKQFNTSLAGSASFIGKKCAEFAQSPAGQKGLYTPHMSTWLNGDRFLDEWEEWQLIQETGNGTQKQSRLELIGRGLAKGNALDHGRGVEEL